MKTLYELTEVGKRISELVENEPDFTVALNDIKSEFNDKVGACGAVYKNLIAESDMFDKEFKKLAMYAKARENSAERLRLYVEDCMKIMKVEEIKQGVITVKFRKLPAIVDVFDQSKLPKEYIRIIPEEYKPDKILLEKDLKEGKIIEGCSLITNRRKVEIK